MTVRSVCFPPGARTVLKILSPLEFIRPQVHWKNDNILLEAGNLTLRRALARDKETVHTHNLSDALLFSIEYHLLFSILGLFPLILVF